MKNIIKIILVIKMKQDEEIQEKLIRLYNECIEELNTIEINVLAKEIGSIDIKINNRSKKRYGACKQEEPDKRYIRKLKVGRKIVIQCDRFNKHHIEISRWVMDLNDKIIKNTIIHEIIHCLPYCNNHGKEFKQYSKVINEKLGYNISRLGNKAKDMRASNIDYEEKKPNYKYEIICQKCGQKVLRQRIVKNFAKKYRCRKMQWEV